jgi:hypothetical protein
MAHFQIKLAGCWKDFAGEEDRVVRRVFIAGHPKLWNTVRGELYEYDFELMLQRNVKTGRSRSIRPPYAHAGSSARQPSHGLLPVVVVEVPVGCSGCTIEVPHPESPSRSIPVIVPESAKAGQKMMVLVPEKEEDQAWNNNNNNNAIPIEPSVGATPRESIRCSCTCTAESYHFQPWIVSM